MAFPRSTTEKEGSFRRIRCSLIEISQVFDVNSWDNRFWHVCNANYKDVTSIFEVPSLICSYVRLSKKTKKNSVIYFMSKTTTLLAWFCSQRILFLLKKSFRVTLDEPIILTILMLLVPASLRRCQVRLFRVSLSGFCLLVITLVAYNRKQPRIIAIQQPQTCFVHILIWLPDLVRVCVFRRDSESTSRVSLIQVTPQMRDICCQIPRLWRD